MGIESQAKTEAIAEIKKKVQLGEWQKQIEERQTAGIGVEAWCKREGIGKSTYYYRLRKVREYLCQMSGSFPEVSGDHEKEEKQIVPISVPVRTSEESKIEISIGELRISFTGGASPDALKTVIEALQSC